MRRADDVASPSTDQTQWAFVARTVDLDGDGPFHVSAEGVDAVLVRVAGELRAFQGLCPHQGALLGEGELDGEFLVYRNHRWRFSGATGERDGGPECLRRYDVRVREGRVELALPTASTRADARTNATRTPADLPGPRGLPLVGSALSVDVAHFHEVLDQWCRAHGPTFQVRLGRHRVVATSEPELINQLLRERPRTFRRVSTFERLFTELGVDGVFSAEGDAWHVQRKLAMGALNPRHVRTFFPTLHQVLELFLARLERAAAAGEVLDLQAELMRFTVDVTTRLAFSQETRSIDGEEDELLAHIDEILPALARRVTAIVPYWRWFRLPRDRRVDAAIAFARAWLGEVIERTRAELAADPQRAANPTNFLEAMLCARDAEGRPFDDHRIYGNALTMLLAGEDTTANTIAWAVHLLLDHPADAERFVEQVDDLLGDARLPASEAVARTLAALDPVANEAMRLKPVAPMLLLEAKHDTVVGDIAIAGGTRVVALTRMAAMNPERVEEPERFLPSRWDDRHAVAQLQRSGTFVPFGSGPRICPGRSLALTEIRVVLATIYRNFEVERVGRSEDVVEEFGFTVSPRGLAVRLRPRPPATA